MKQKSILAFIFLSFLLFSCSTPKKKFEKGKYDQAFDLAYKKLKKGKGDRADKSILNRSFRALVGERNEQVQLWTRGNNIDQWELGYALYADLMKKYKDANKYLVSNQEELYKQVSKDQSNLENRIVDTLL